MLPCVSYKWESTSRWQDCNETCGAFGTQSRVMVCRKYYDEDYIEDVGASSCEDKQESETRECNRRPCYTIKWLFTENWSECSKSCGTEAVKEKQVVCKNVTYDDREIILPDRFCESAAKPVMQQNCNLPECSVQYSWSRAADWSSCSVSCGSGVQVREQKCIRTQNGISEITENANCGNITLTNMTRNCDAGPCGYLEWGAGPWSAVNIHCSF